MSGGWKVGMASARRPPGAPGPVHGRVHADRVLPDGATIDAAQLRAPEAEGEIAFVLGRDLRGPGATIADALAATRGVMAAIEVIAEGGGAGAASPGGAASGAASPAGEHDSAFAVLGTNLVSVDAVDLRLLGLVLTRNGAVVATGAGAEALGHPAHSVAWLTNALAEQGDHLRAGEVVLTGSISGALPVAAGDVIGAELDRLGGVTARFS